MVGISVFLIILWLFPHLHPGFGQEAKIAKIQNDIFLAANDIYEIKWASLNSKILVYYSIWQIMMS